jgi:hypothetical protein
MKFPLMQEDQTLDEYFKQIKKICIKMQDTKHNLKQYNNKKTVAFVTLADGVRYSEQPHYKIHSLIEDYFFVKEDLKVATTTVALIFNEIMKNNG